MMLQNLAVDDVKELALLQKYLTKALLVALIYIIIQNVPLLLQNVEVTHFFAWSAPAVVAPWIHWIHCATACLA